MLEPSPYQIGLSAGQKYKDMDYPFPPYIQGTAPYFDWKDGFDAALNAKEDECGWL